MKPVIFFELSNSYTRIFLALLASAALSACSGGGGGGSGSSGPSPNTGVQSVTYVGNPNPATVTSVNAATLADAALTGGSVAASTAVGVDISVTPTSGEPRITKMTKLMQQSLARANLGPSSVSGVQLNVPLNCGISGTATADITVDDSNGKFTGTIVFAACSDISGESLSGTVAVTGHISIASLQIDFMTTDGTLAFADNFGSFTFTGITATTSSYASTTERYPSSISVLANLDVRNNTSGTYLKLTNFTITGTLADDTLSGTMCHSVAGCVTVQTMTAFRFNNDTDLWPSSGQMVITGVGNDTKARLTALSSVQYNLEWDADGNGIYDPGSVSKPWPIL